VSGLDTLVPHLKGLHIGFISIWMAGLMALPAMLARHEQAIGQVDFQRIRRATHYGYVWAITPAAALAVATGLALIFLREVFVPWMFAKLVLVACLVGLHAWIGHTIIAVAETEGRHEPPEPTVPIILLGAAVAGVLLLVIFKPDLAGLPIPDFLRQPVRGDLPFDVPSP
jgi:protoporphyrinogen IX oxidase